MSTRHLPQAAIRFLVATAALCGALALVGCGGGSSSADDPSDIPTASAEEAKERDEPELEVPDGPPPKKLILQDLIEGTGAEAERGDEVGILYIGRNWDGSLFSNSWDYNTLQHFVLGEKLYPPGFYDGILGMRVGGRRKVIVPTSRYYYPGEPHSPLQPREDTIVFIVDLFEIRKDRR